MTVAEHFVRFRRPWSLALPIAAGLFIGLGALAIVWVFARALAVILLSITIADALSPVVRWLQRWTSRSVAAVSIYLIIFGLAVAMVTVLAPVVVQEGQLLADKAPTIVNQLQVRFDRWLSFVPDGATSEITRAVAQSSQKLLTLPISIGSAFVTAILIIFLSFYWLVASPSINSFFKSLFPAHLLPKVDRVRSEMSRAMGGYLRAAILDALATGSLAWIGLFLAGVELSFVLGAITAVAELIPYVGPILAAIPAVLVGLLQSPAKAFWALVVYTAILQIEGHILAPNIMRSQTSVPQVLVIAALFAGGVVGGILGILVAVPVAGATKVLMEEVFVPWLHDRYHQRYRDSVTSPAETEP